MGRVTTASGDNSATPLFGNAQAPSGASPTSPPAPTFPPTPRAPTPPTASRAPTPPTNMPTSEPTAGQVPSAPTHAPTRALPPVVNVTWNFIDGKVRTSSDVSIFCTGGLKASTVVSYFQKLKKRSELAVDTWTASISSTAANTTTAAEADALALFLRNSNSSVVQTNAVVTTNAKPSSNTAGIAVGVVFGLLALILIVAVVFYIYLRKKRTDISEDFHAY